MSVAKTAFSVVSQLQVEPLAGVGVGVDLPALEVGSLSVPKPADMAAWRRIADLQLENVLARFDDALLKEEAPAAAASAAILELRNWIRMSLRAMPTTNAMRMLGARATQEEWDRWNEMGRKASGTAPTDPGAVDRYLRLYLGMAHELAARGYASMIVDVPLSK